MYLYIPFARIGAHTHLIVHPPHFFSIFSHRDDKGRLPLHIAIQQCCMPIRGIKKDLNANRLQIPNMIHSLKDMNIDKPTNQSTGSPHPPLQLHSYSTDTLCYNANAWKLIWKCYPSAIRMEDDKDLLPFMLAAYCSQTNITFELLRSAPDVICQIPKIHKTE